MLTKNEKIEEVRRKLLPINHSVLVIKELFQHLGLADTVQALLVWKILIEIEERVSEIERIMVEVEAIQAVASWGRT